MTTNPPRAIVPLEDCKQCYGSGMEFVSLAILTGEPGYEVCQCVLDQLDSYEQPFTIDTTPNDLTKWADVVEP